MLLCANTGEGGVVPSPVDPGESPPWMAHSVDGVIVLERHEGRREERAMRWGDEHGVRFDP